MNARTNQDWIDLLLVRDEVAVGELRETLCRGLSSVLAGKADHAAVEDFGQEATLRVLDRLNSYRGDSRFMTWALAVATRVAFSELRKARYKDVSLDTLAGAGHAFAEPVASANDQAPGEDRQEILGVLRRLIDTDLTEKQRTVIVGELSGIPQVVLADKLGTNLNALYKLAHDARMKLKKGLVAAGLSADEVRQSLAGES